MKNYFILFLKGIAMGVANVIPGVSGGTIALITGIYEELIDSLKSFDKTALKYLLRFKKKEFVKHTNLNFILIVFGGSIGVLFLIAYPLEYLLNKHEKLIYALFFGLILASILSIVRLIKKWNFFTIIATILGFIIAIIVTNITPSNENNNLLYIFICGIVSISGMMLPGLSGSHILILLGNYKLIFASTLTGFMKSIKSIFDSNQDFDYEPLIILSVFCVGALFGLLSFSRIISWLLKKFKDQTIALLTGFIIGSLTIIWPWKKIKESIRISEKEIVTEYDLYFPTSLDIENLICFLMILIGIISIYAIERYSKLKA